MLVSDDEIRSAIVAMIATTRNLVEAAGAAPLAAALRLRERLAGKRVALICSGGNISPAQLGEVLVTRSCRRPGVGSARAGGATDPVGLASSAASSEAIYLVFGRGRGARPPRPARQPRVLGALAPGRRRARALRRSSGGEPVSSEWSSAGALLGLVATAWTLIVPVLAIVLVVLTFNGAQRGPVAP